MLVLFRWLQRALVFGGLAFAFVFGVLLVTAPSVSAASCSFHCSINYSDAPGAASSCTPVSGDADDAQCANNCRAQCQNLGWYPAGRAVCASRTGRDGFGVCVGCECTPRLIMACDVGSAGDASCATDCGSACNADNLPRRLLNPASGISCRTSAPTPRCVAAQTDICRECVNRCLSQSAGFGTAGVPADCYRGCLDTTSEGRTAPDCQGVPQEQAIQGMTSAPSGAVSGSGERRSRITSGVSPSASEAARLAAGECATRAVRADAANASLIRMVEAQDASYASTTWRCRRVCSNTQESSCVTGGCPGDSAIRCCPEAMNIGTSPTQQCGDVGASNGGTDSGTPGAAGGTQGGDPSSSGGDTGSSGGAGTSGSSSGGSNSGSSGSSVVGASSVSADSGGLTRLILPACVEDGACQFSDLVQVALNAVRFLFGLAGVLLLVAFVYAGIEYLIAGDAASVKSAEDRIKKAVLGLFIMFFGYTLVSFLVGLFVRA